MELGNLANEINFHMVKRLKRTKISTKIIKILVNDNTKQHLAEKYALKGRYKQANQFLLDFDILKKRNMSLNSYCMIKNNSLELKFNNNRKVNYFLEENGVMVSIFSNNKL